MSPAMISTLEDKAYRLPSLFQAPFRWTNKARYASHRAQIRQVFSEHPQAKPSIIFPPSLDWRTQLFQRPQQLAIALARQGALVFYIQPRTAYTEPGITILEDRLILCDLPAASFWFLKESWVYLLTWNWKYAAAFQNPQIIYDYLDELTVFQGYSHQLIDRHNQLVHQARLVLATAKKLYDDLALLRSDALLCPNGVDFEFFATVRSQVGPPPDDLLPILATSRQIVGFHGALANWFDYELLKSLAQLRPDLSFVLIGPDFDGALAHSGLLESPNIFWLGQKPYHKLPEYLQFFDVAMIPFKLNDVTHAISPLKLFEYMAAGIPIVTTPMVEASRYPVVLATSQAAEFSEKINQACQLKHDSDYLNQLKKTAQENTWDARALQILDAIQKTGRAAGFPVNSSPH